MLLIDALWYRFVNPGLTPFLASLCARHHFARLQTILGYSSAIRATAFSGEPPSRHGNWGKFTYDPKRSQFSEVKRLAFVDRLPSTWVQRLVRFGLSKSILDTILKAERGSRLSLENVPIAELPNFVYHTEAPSNLTRLGVPTVFNSLSDMGKDWRYVNIPFMPTARQRAAVSLALSHCDLLAVYIGGLDAAAHRVGRDGQKLVDPLRRIDRFVQSVFKEAEEVLGKGFGWVVFSDHGIETVSNYVDPMKLRQALWTRDIQPKSVFFDSTMMRVWGLEPTLSSRQLNSVERLGHFISPGEASRFGVDFRTPEFGQQIFLLNPGVVFHPSYVSWLRPKGMHGYSPDVDSQFGVLVSKLGCEIRSDHSHPMSDIKRLVIESVVADA